MLLFTRFSFGAMVVGLCAELAVAGPLIDCNDNGIADDVDIADGTSVDRNLDGIPDECDIGACCIDASPSCAQINQIECDELGGTWFRGMPCTAFSDGGACDRDLCCPRDGSSSASCETTARFECWGPDLVFDGGITCDQLGCDAAALIRLRAVAVNHDRIVPTTAITVHPGDTIEVEVYLSNWGPTIGGLKTWQVTMATEIAAHSGDYGSIAQRTYEVPVGFCADVDRPCGRSTECRRCAGGPDEGLFCDFLTDCRESACEVGVCIISAEGGFFIQEFVCSSSSSRAGASCQLDEECPSGACIVRPDFVFAADDQRICATSRFFVAGCTGFTGALIPDDGREYYAVTAIYGVTEDALGAFTIPIAGNPAITFLSGSTGDADYGVDPLRVTVVPPPPTGACCDCSGSSSDSPLDIEPICRNGVTLAECERSGQTWTEDATCAEITCECPFEAIPVTSEWGLLVLALTLMIGINIAFSGRRRPASA